MTSSEPGDIGARARRIRRRRGLSLDAVAGLSGISKGYLSRLENGERHFNRRGLIEDVARALGCSPADLTGSVVVASDERAAVAESAIPAVSAALHDSTLDDVPDVVPRDLSLLSELAHRANADADNVRYDGVADSVLGDLITELHVHSATRPTEQRQRALESLVVACLAAYSLARTLNHGELAVSASRRGWDAARRLERPNLVGFMAMARAVSLNRIGARHRARSVVDGALADLGREPGPTDQRSAVAEATGMLHLSAAQVAAKDGRLSEAETHLDEARALARHTGERNHLHYHFGPANVAAWSLAVAVETGRGTEEAERYEQDPIDTRVFESADREAAVWFDLARAYAEAEGSRDDLALRYLDRADRVAPLRFRRDPVVREVLSDLDQRARRRVWELDSLKRRLGVA